MKYNVRNLFSKPNAKRLAILLSIFLIVSVLELVILGAGLRSYYQNIVIEILGGLVSGSIIGFALYYILHEPEKFKHSSETRERYTLKFNHKIITNVQVISRKIKSFYEPIINTYSNPIKSPNFVINNFFYALNEYEEYLTEKDTIIPNQNKNIILNELLVFKDEFMPETPISVQFYLRYFLPRISKILFLIMYNYNQDITEQSLQQRVCFSCFQEYSENIICKSCSKPLNIYDVLNSPGRSDSYYFYAFEYKKYFIKSFLMNIDDLQAALKIYRKEVSLPQFNEFRIEDQKVTKYFITVLETVLSDRIQANV